MASRQIESADFIDKVLEYANLSQALGMTVVAEGVEESSQVEILRGIGCTFAQGYFFAKPLPLEEAISKRSAKSAPFSTTLAFVKKYHLDIWKN